MINLKVYALLAAFVAVLVSHSAALAGGAQLGIPMLRHSVKPGATIAASDLINVKVDAKFLNTQSVRKADDIVGLAARRPLSAGRQLRLSDFEIPAVVRKGSRVTMVLSAGALRLTAMGTAMEDGADGAYIKIKNNETHQSVYGHVLAPNLVEVLPVGQLALR
ncbi:MAG: flagellar basal body P-ring formation chaperone FlgA [Pseudomonadota bacterium]